MHILAAPHAQVAIQEPRTGRWFITMGNPGFNSPANNRDGYRSEASALRASRRYGAKA